MRSTRTRLTGWLLVAPFCLCTLLFYVYPALRGLSLSFADGWIGEFKPSLAAWGRVFSPNFWKSVLASGRFSLYMLPFTGIAVAVVVGMQHLPKGFCTGVQTALYLPTLAAGVSMSLVWKTLFHPSKGLLNLILGTETLWLADPAIAPISITVVQAIPTLGPLIYLMSTFTAQIPDTLYEQARLDGCGFWRSVFRITLPILTPVILFAVASALMTGSTMFAPVMLLTGGGPAHATSSLTWLIYETAFIGGDLPRAAGTSIIHTIATLPIMVMLYRSIWREI